MKDFRDLRVFQAAFEGSVAIFSLSTKRPPHERYSMVSQVRESSRSVCANIAEAWRKRRYPKSFISKLSDADGEAAETIVWLMFAVKHGYLSDATFEDLRIRYDRINAQLTTMMDRSHQWCPRVWKGGPSLRDEV